jgi:glucose/arabinose dehydrogenase
MRISRFLVACTVALVTLPAAAEAARSAGRAPGFRLERMASGLEHPTYLTSPPGDRRLFVVEQTGTIRVINDGQLLATPFADLSSRVTEGGEQGLLGLAFHPDYATNGRLFVYYTARNRHQQVWELHAEPGSDVISGARRLLIDMADPFSNHNGGDLQFGPDGYLYIGTGDGGAGGDPGRRSQNLKVPLGKLLRIDVDAHPSGRPYGIPADNPFAGEGRGRGLAFLYAWGLRNPWRFSFDRKTGDLWIGDVGQNAWEEVDHVAKGKARGVNFGWSNLEATHSFDASHALTGGGRLVAPVVEYSHSLGCSITGGYVYRGPSIRGLDGRYVYADYCSGRMWTLARGSKTPIDVTTIGTAVGLRSPVSFGEGSDGTLYEVSGRGEIYRFAAAT